jgi:hypothetical protein
MMRPSVVIIESVMDFSLRKVPRMIAAKPESDSSICESNQHSRDMSPFLSTSEIERNTRPISYPAKSIAPISWSDSSIMVEPRGGRN